MSPSNPEIDAYFSDPLNFPLAFKQWLVAYLEVNQPFLIATQLSQKGTDFGRGSTGFIDMWGGSTAPSGAVMCDGASYLRSDGVHDALFAIIGTTNGAVDGTHFNVPDLLDRVPVGAGGNSALGLTDAIAAANRHNTRHRHTTVVNESAHAHQITSNDAFNHTASSGATGTAAGDRNLLNITTTGGATTGLTVTTGASASDPLDGPAFVAINFVIWL